MIRQTIEVPLLQHTLWSMALFVLVVRVPQVQVMEEAVVLPQLQLVKQIVATRRR